MRLQSQKSNVRTALVVLLTSTAFAAPAMAQQAAEEDSNVIVVTAQKREQNLQDVPIAINAIGNAVMAQTK